MIALKLLKSMMKGAVISAGAATIILGIGTAGGQPARKPLPSTQREVFLVRQDFSDCTNSNVPNTDGPNVAGFVAVIRGSDGNTTLKIALTGTPKTTYHFFLKCVRILGDITTGEEGTALASFTFPTSSAGNVYAFDSYPEGAPAGNKFQSATVSFQ